MTPGFGKHGLMDEHSLLEILSGRRRDPLARLARWLTWSASGLYGAAIRLRNGAYDREWFPVTRVPVPVLSVGNLTTGGTGKTPVVAWLVRELQHRGYRPGIVSRGYRALDGERNDEARVLEQLCPGVPHVQHRDRVFAARRVVIEHRCDVIVLDDGFQHRRLHRDLDLVLIDVRQPWGYGHLLPRGLMREPRSSLWRADLALFTRVEPQDLLTTVPELTRQVHQHHPQLPVAAMRFVPQGWSRRDGESLPLSALQQRTSAAFCGIGNPASFIEFARTWTQVRATRSYADHHHYSWSDLHELAAWREEQQADVLVTTLKDLVKIPADHPVSRHVYALEIASEVVTGHAALQQALDCLCPVRAVPKQDAA